MSTTTHATDAKAIATVAARLALEGRELRAIQKEGCVYFKVRHKGRCRPCRTLRDLLGFMEEIGGSRA